MVCVDRSSDSPRCAPLRRARGTRPPLSTSSLSNLVPRLTLQPQQTHTANRSARSMVHSAHVAYQMKRSGPAPFSIIGFRLPFQGTPWGSGFGSHHRDGGVALTRWSPWLEPCRRGDKWPVSRRVGAGPGGGGHARAALLRRQGEAEKVDTTHAWTETMRKSQNWSAPPAGGVAERPAERPLRTAPPRPLRLLPLP